MIEPMKVPDLWVKRRLALAIVPDGARLREVTAERFSECMRGAGLGSASAFSHAIVGDDACRVSDELFYLAAAFEYVVLRGTPQIEIDKKSTGFGRTHIERYVDEVQGDLALYPEPISGTFGEFARALEKVVERRADFRRRDPGYFRRRMSWELQRMLRDELGRTTDNRGSVTILHGRDRDSALARLGPERIIVQKRRETCAVRAKEYVQLLLPRAQREQWAFGVELCTDEPVLAEAWSDGVGSWFPPVLQPANTPIMLLDDSDPENPPRMGDWLGAHWIQMIGIDAAEVTSQHKSIDKFLAQLLASCPHHWPPNYGQVVATLTLARKMSTNNKRAEKKRQREDERHPDDPNGAKPLPTGGRLYTAEYTVVPAAGDHNAAS